jgi:SAM-dependent methyltransferase
MPGPVESRGILDPEPTRYDRIGLGYRAHRRADPRIAAQIHRAVGDAQRVVNVGAGAGSYEPTDRPVIAVEPSAVMLAQRPDGSPPAARAVAEALPFPDGSFDAALALMTLHHWTDQDRGLAELARVAPKRVLFTYDVAIHDAVWIIRDYLPAAANGPGSRAIDEICGVLGQTRVEVVPVPADCTDGFVTAYWAQPERYLDPAVRASMSILARLPESALAPGLARLDADLKSGRWHDRYGHLTEQPEIDGGLRLVISG